MPVTLTAGNHDAHVATLPAAWGVEVVDALTLGPFHFAMPLRARRPATCVRARAPHRPGGGRWRRGPAGVPGRRTLGCCPRSAPSRVGRRSGARERRLRRRRGPGGRGASRAPTLDAVGSAR
ncbi:MAG: hypothetical protein R3F43_24860 [bacterium]